MKYMFVFLFACFFCITPLLAEDQDKKEPLTEDCFNLQNGDRITGNLEKFEDDAIFLKTDTMGDVKIPWDNVKSVESKRILYFRLENGNVIAAQAQGVEGDKQVLMTTIAGRLLIPRSSILVIGPTEESTNPDYIRLQKELKETQEKLHKATTVSEVWSGYLEATFSGNEGNKNDRTFIGIGHVERNAEFDKFTGHIEGQYAQARRETTKNQIQGYLKEAIDITPRVYVFGQVSGEWDEVNDLNLRFRAELGVGYHFLKEKDFEMFAGDKITLDGEIGGHFTSTDYKKAEDFRTGGTIVRVIYRQIFPNEWKLEFLGEYYQSYQAPRKGLSSTSDYSLRAKITLAIPITGALSFTGSIWDEYNNVTANSSVRRNDFYWAFGLRLTI